MEAKIHPTAIIEAGAQLDQGVTVGAHAYIGAQVQIASGTQVMHHATVDGNTTLGSDNEIHPYAYIGGKTHDLKYQDGIHRLKIGDHNVFREYEVRGINKVGLQRAEFSEEAISGVRKAYKQIYKKGLNRSQAIKSIVESELFQIKEVQELIAFIEASERGIA